MNIIKKYKHIIENKETGGIPWRDKENAWQQIEKEFNATSGVFRSAEVLKRFYNNKKKDVRKQAANERTNLCKTGGGQAIKIATDPTYDLTLEIINKKTVFGLNNKFDDDARVLPLVSITSANSHSNLLF